MSNDIFKGQWQQLKGKVKETWGKLTDDDMTRINGKKDQLLGRLQERYGWEEKRAEEEYKKFERSLENVKEKKMENRDRDYFEKGGKHKNDDQDFPHRKAR